MNVNHAPMKLGKLAPRVDKRTLRLARYMTDLPAAPASMDVSSALPADLGMMLNDHLGDCTCAGMAHAVQTWTACNGGIVTLSDADVLRAYEEACGYSPSDPSTDQGGVELDVLNYFRSVGIGGHKIGAFASIDPKNREHLKAAIWLFGGVYIGVALPISAQTQDVWRIAIAGTEGDPTPGSWGGHCVFVPPIYDADGLACITWGQTKRMTWEWWDAYCDEAYALLSPDWVQPGKDAPSGFDLAALQADLAAVIG